MIESYHPILQLDSHIHNILLTSIITSFPIETLSLTLDHILVDASIKVFTWSMVWGVCLVLKQNLFILTMNKIPFPHIEWNREKCRRLPLI